MTAFQRHPATPERRIAVVGSGIGGMAAAWYLSSRHRVTLFEAGDRLGGHTATVDVELEGRHYAIDTGFIVFNDWTYPHFQRLLARLGVLTQPTEMSFSVHETARDFEYNGHTLASLFAQRRNLLRPSFYRLLRDILRFNREATRALESGDLDPTMTLGEWLEANGYGEAFQRRYLLPMGAAIWSGSLQELRDFPLQFFVRFFRNHGLLSVNDRPQWHTLVGGSRSYIPALTAPYAGRIRLSTPVRGIRRLANGVELRTESGVEHFDEVVLACHADQALALLEDPSPAEREILGALPYQDNEVVLHTDTRLLPRRRRAWASWNYRLDGRDEGQRISVTYPGCCTGSVRSPQMPGSVGIKGIWGGVWLFFDQVPVLRAHLPPPPCLFCAGDSTPRRYPGTSLLANIRKRSCSGYWLFNISRMVRVLRVMTAPIFSSFRRMVLTWAWAKAVRLR